jgi:zinc metalloprotease ZmpB
MPFPINANVRVERDDSGNVQHLEHFQQPFVAAATSAEAAAAAEAGVPAATATDAQALAREYLRQVAPIYGLRESELPDDGDAALSGAAAAPAAAPVGSKLRLTEQKEVLDTTTITYQQTYDGIPVWEAGTSVTIQPAPMRVTASQSSVHRDIVLPAEDALARGDHSPDSMTPDVVKRLLGVPADAPLVINGKPRLVIYQYDPEKRTDPSAQMPAGEMLHGGPPTLALPPLAETIFPGQHYIVTEVLFTMPVAGHGR